MQDSRTWRARAEEYRAVAHNCGSAAARMAYEALADSSEDLAERIDGWERAKSASLGLHLPMLRSAPSNGLLSAISPADYQLLEPHLERVEFGLHHCFEQRDQPIEHAHFILHGLASIHAARGHAKEIEVGLIGPEGMTGLSVVLEDDRSPHSTYAHAAGAALRIHAGDLRAALSASNSLRRVLLNYVHVRMVQTSQTALANGCCKIEERLARWLLMADDRLDGGHMPLTHEFLSVMLGVRRAGVTVALHELESRSLIHASRGRIVVVDRQGLEDYAGNIYGVAEETYRRLIAPSGRAAAVNGVDQHPAAIAG